jgi:predicted transposase YdaD
MASFWHPSGLRESTSTSPMPADPPPGLSVLELVTAPQQDVESLVARLRRRAETELAASPLGAAVIELVEEVLIRRFSRLTREEVRSMFQLEDLRKTKVWQEAHEEGKAVARKEIVQNCLAQGMSIKEIAQLLKMSAQEVRRLAKTKRAER